MYMSKKDVMVRSYEGDVQINNAPSNVRTSKLVEIAREVLQERLKRPIVNLSNVEYLNESKMYKYFEHQDSVGVEYEYSTVEYDSYK